MLAQQSCLRKSLVVLCLMPFISGCGAGRIVSTAPPSTPATASFLTGNWLLAGTLPLNAVLSGPVNPNFGAAATFTVVGNDVLATLQANFPCGSTSSSVVHEVLTGTAASDGSISMATSPSGFGAASISGKLPSTSGASSWTGHLNISNGSGFSCTATQDLDFTATRIADVTGTYTGNTSIIAGGLPQSAKASFVLQQATSAPGGLLTNAFLLTGSVTVQGSSCVSSGTLSTPPTSPPQTPVPISSILGSEVRIQATMNDGSIATIFGYIMDTDSSKITVSNLFGNGGTCGIYSASTFVLTRQ